MPMNAIAKAAKPETLGMTYFVQTNDVPFVVVPVALVLLLFNRTA